MKSKRIRSLNSQFLFINIITMAIAIILVITFLTYSNLNKEINDSPMKLVSNFNSLYIDAKRFVTRVDNGCEDYLNKVSEYYKASVVIVDDNGNIIMKSKYVQEDKIDMDEIKAIFKGNIKLKDRFYQKYDITINNTDYKFIVWKDREAPVENRDRLFFIIFVIIMLCTLLSIYLFTNKKVKYINEIVKGVDEFSKGNLDYNIKEQGKDELFLLAKDSNAMAKNLKETIEEEKRLQRLKTELITNVSHDLRTPLTSLIGYLQLVDNENIKEEDRKKYADISLEKAKGLNTLIEDLFNYSKLESGGIALEKSSVNIIEVLEQTIGETSIDISEKEMLVEKNFSSKVIMANIDSMQMGRVFQNLLNNAVKYGLNKGEIRISASQLENKIYVSFENSTDNLIEDEVNLLFERFYRGDISRSSKVKGSGLGLAIAKSIVELHGGKIGATIKDGIFKVVVELSCYNSEAICSE